MIGFHVGFHCSPCFPHAPSRFTVPTESPVAIPRLFALCLPLLAVSCQTKPYAPPPRLALVESVEVEVGEFAGRPEVFAVVKGRLSTSVAQLIAPRQSRIGRTLVIEVREQTPRGATPLPDLGQSPPFETRIPVEVLGLEPGPCLLHANGIETPFEISFPRAVLASSSEPPRPPAVSLVDEFIPAAASPPALGGNPR